MSPPGKGRFGSSSSSTGTVPKSNSRMNGVDRRMADQTSSTLRQQSQQLERLLIEQQAKLRSLEQQQQNTNDRSAGPPTGGPECLTESLQDLRDKLQLLQTLNGAASAANSGPRHEHYDFSPLYGDDRHEILNNLRRDVQNQWHFLEKKKQQHCFNPMEQLQRENSELRKSVQQQQEQIHQLTQSLNQCFQAVLTIQRDVSSLQQTVSASNSEDKDNHVTLEDNLDSVSQQHDFEGHHGSSTSWEFEFHHRPLQTSNANAALDPWSNFFANSDSRLMSLGGSESGVSTAGTSGALNNTVPPGIRANNYWDNFRSFSRQNRLSSSNIAAGLSPVIAQVTPRQAPQLHLPHSPFRANNSNAAVASAAAAVAAAAGDHQLLENAAMVEPYFSSMGSPSRPKRKQKINREQNVSSNSLSRSRPLPEAAMVFPIRQQQPSQSSHQQPQQQPLQNEVQPIHQQALNPVVTSIKRSIYSHVNELIAQNEERPEQLARIFRDLQSINRTASVTVDSTSETLANLNVSSSGGNSRHHRHPWGSMYDGIGDDDDLEEHNVSTTTTSSPFFKNTSLKQRFNSSIATPAVASSSSASATVVTTTASSTNDNRLALLAASSAAAIMPSPPDVDSSGGSSLIVSQDDERLPMFAFETPDALSSLGAVGGAPDSLESGMVPSKKMNEEASKQQNVVAVPKNIQRNIISRERDGRKIRRGEKPRNMMTQASEEGEPIGFVPIKFRNDIMPMAAEAVHGANNNGSAEQSDMAEADQGQITERADSSEFMDLQSHEIGLDRVPTRLSASELENRRQEEDENIQNLVEEVLNSTSSEVDFVVGNTDHLSSPPPK